MAASLAAYYRRIRIGHVEARLRTHDKRQPFPEEINRRVASVVTDLHFPPTEWARDNLLHEHIPAQHIVVTGNPVIDALQSVVRLPPPPEVPLLLNRLGVPQRSLSGDISGDGRRRLVLITAHRRENFGTPMEEICQALLHLARLYDPDVQFVYPVHLNPNVQEPVHRILEQAGE